MTATTLITEVLDVLLGGLTTTATKMGQGISAMASSIFIDGDGLSVMGLCIVLFAGISLSLSLFRWVLNFFTSLAARNR